MNAKKIAGAIVTAAIMLAVPAMARQVTIVAKIVSFEPNSGMADACLWPVRESCRNVLLIADPTNAELVESWNEAMPNDLSCEKVQVTGEWSAEGQFQVEQLPVCKK